MANILILRNATDSDPHVKTGVAKVETQNGYAVALGKVSKERATRNAFEVAAPAAKTDKIGLVYNADVPCIYDEMGNVYKGIVSDPRNIKFPAGTIVNIYMPGTYDEIAMTEVGGTKTESTKYVIYKAGSMTPEYADTTDDAVEAFEITDESFVSIGSERVKTVEMIHVNLA